jgi:nicotinate-nucleotide adenylyltransferase
VWLTLTPRNPLKDPHNLIPDLKRLAMLNIATKNLDGIETCDIELSMPTPNYTINTLDTLAKRYPAKKFKIIIGSDNWAIFEQWRDWQRILDEYGVIVYPRPGHEITNVNVDGMELVDAPLLDISSTFVRSAVGMGRDMSCFVPNGVYKYIVDNKLYQKVNP